MHILMPHTYAIFVDVAAEKQHKGLVQGIEGFHKEELHPTQTMEKNPLPDKQSKMMYRAVK